MAEIEQEDVALDQENNEETTEEAPKEEAKGKPKRTPEEELEYFEGRAKRLRKQLGTDKSDEAPVAQPSSKTGDIDLSALAYLRATLGVKGQAEIGLVKEYMKAGKDILDLENNRHFMNDLKDLREAADTKAAIPTSSKRSGAGAGNDFDLAYAKYEQTGELPTDFELRAKIVKTKAMKSSDTTPSWRRG